MAEPPTLSAEQVQHVRETALDLPVTPPVVRTDLIMLADSHEGLRARLVEAERDLRVTEGDLREMKARLVEAKRQLKYRTIERDEATQAFRSLTASYDAAAQGEARYREALERYEPGIARRLAGDFDEAGVVEQPEAPKRSRKHWP